MLFRSSGGVIYIGVDSSTGPILFFSEPYTEMIKEQNRNRMTKFITSSNRIIVAYKDKGCGCGSRLKNWYPKGQFAISEGRR